MELVHEFKVSVPVDEAWAVLTDLERVATCMPGAELTEVVGDEYHGVVKVKVGPITSRYAGVVRFTEMDPVGYRAVLHADGRDARGQGNASAIVTAVLRGDGNSTVVSILTDLSITGKLAQFGRSVLADVSSSLLGQFVERLEADVLSGDSRAGAHQESTPEAGVDGPAARSDQRGSVDLSAEPVDLLSVVGSLVRKRAVPLGIGFAGFVLLVWMLRRRH